MDLGESIKTEKLYLNPLYIPSHSNTTPSFVPSFGRKYKTLTYHPSRSYNILNKKKEQKKPLAPIFRRNLKI